MRIVMGIDPGLAHTGWGVIEQRGSHLACVAYGCVATPASQPLAERLMKIHHQIGAVVERFRPECVGIETVWFGQNVTAEKDLVQYMVRHLLSLDRPPEPDHAADALAAAICYTTHENGRLS